MSPAEMSRLDHPGKSNPPASPGPNPVLHRQVGNLDRSLGKPANLEVSPAAVQRADNPVDSNQENNPVSRLDSNNCALSSRNSRPKPHRWRSTRPNNSAQTRLRPRQPPRLRRVASRLPRVLRVRKPDRRLSRLARQLRQRKQQLER